MSAVAGVSIKYKGHAPSTSEIIAEAERIGSLKLVSSATPQGGGHKIMFAALPTGQVTIAKLGDSEVFITDDSFKADALYRLLWQAASQLGGTPTCARPLRLPLTEGLVRQNDARARFIAHLGISVLILFTVFLVVAVATMVYRFTSAA
jgi:hypothetical protein